MPDVELLSVINTIINKLSLEKTSIDFKQSSGGFVADVNAVKVKHAEGNLNLYVKRVTDVLGKFLAPNEINFYEKIAPALNKLSKDEFVEIPKFYHASEFTLFLEDLMEKGFGMWKELKVPLDRRHVEVVLKAYGKLHGLSFALKELQPEVFEEVSVDCPEIMCVFQEHYKDSRIMEKTAEVATKSFVGDLEVYGAAYRDFMKNVNTFLLDLVQNNKYNVFIHGDCWTNNFLFKDSPKSDLEVRMIDFQLSRKTSPIVDLSYFFCTSACSQEIFDNMNEYLQIYHDSLSETLKKLNCDVNKVFSFSTFMEEWKKYGKYGLTIGVFISKMIIAEEEEVEANRTPRGLLYGFNFLSKNEKLFDERMKTAIKYFFSLDGKLKL